MQEYIQRVANRFAQYVDPRVFAKQLLTSTYAMINSTDYSLTNIEVFAADFFPALGLDPELMTIFETFYVDEFPQLEYLAKPHPRAQAVVQAAFERGLKVVIATNPVFPEIAIR